MLANGASIETVDNLSLSDQRNLYSALQLGTWGPIKDYVIATTIYNSLHAINETQAALVIGKKYKPKEPFNFHELFPAIDDFASLGTANESRSVKSENQIAMKAMAALGGEGAPAWLTDLSNDA